MESIVYLVLAVAVVAAASFATWAVLR